MTPDVFLRDVLDPGLAYLAAMGGPEPSDSARVFLLSVAQQESGCDARYQSSPSASPGPARGWWQFEQGGGVAGVLTHSSSAALATAVCEDLDVVNISSAVWRALEGSDTLATCFARLLVLTDPDPIPTTQQAGWDYYLNLWRPGAPHPDVWPTNWNNACAAVAAAPEGADPAVALLQNAIDGQEHALHALQREITSRHKTLSSLRAALHRLLR